MIDQAELIDTFLQVSHLAHLRLSLTDVRAELSPAPHKRPASLPSGTQAVYTFFLGDRCLKVGKAGPKTQARFTSQHYGINAPSITTRVHSRWFTHASRRFRCEQYAR